MKAILNHIVSVISQYDFSVPLHIFLKNHFRHHRELGSRDRRIIREHTYSFFRIGKNLENYSTEERVAVGAYLTGNNFSPFPSIHNFPDLPALTERLQFIKTIYPDFDPQNIFPFASHLSDDIDKNKWNLSFLNQPPVYIRMRKGFEEEIMNELIQSETPFVKSALLPSALQVNASASLNKLSSYENGFFEIQDLSSQLVQLFTDAKPGETWWDCCAGSGGKSLHLADAVEGVKIIASDLRPSILENMEERFSKVNLSAEVFQADLEKGDFKNHLKGKKIDGIIIDAPCSGSGTWARTPEMLRGFKAAMIPVYQEKQIRIFSNVILAAPPGCKIIYITCSAFKEENETAVEYALNNLNVKPEMQKLIKGYEHGADTMFAARFSKC